MKKKRLVSGIQPTGKMHLGNYLGATKNWVELQNNYDSYFFIADLHALTTAYENTTNIKEHKENLILDLLAIGIDPEQCCLFSQSDIPEHSELHLIFSMITPLPWLTRVPTYKDKINEIKEKDLNTYGFLGYPVLQAADILLYKGEVVPVGKDQMPHLELTREIARRFNFFYSTGLPEPNALLTETPLLPGTDGRKMSKSYNNTIPISEPPEQMQKLVMKMFTDPNRKLKTDPGTPKICPVYAYHKLFNKHEQVTEIKAACKTAQIGCVECKKVLAATLITHFAKFREQREHFQNNPKKVQELIHTSTQKARKIAQETLTEIKSIINL
jgi:tryptophanyl-tRNA synthetase